MSTRSRIGIVNADGTITSVYCHYDGYPEHNGIILRKYYNSEGSALDIVTLGDLSLLAKRLKTDQPHSDKNPIPNVTIAYHRDRNAPFRQHTANNFKDFMRKCYDEVSYAYLWINGSWKFYLVSTYAKTHIEVLDI